MGRVSSWTARPERRAKLEDLKRRGVLQVFEVESGADLTAQAVAARAKAAGVHLYAPPGKAFVCASEGYVMVQAQEEGVMPLDFGQAEAVDDAITGATVGTGPRVNVPFRLGETRLFKARFSPLLCELGFWYNVHAWRNCFP